MRTLLLTAASALALTVAQPALIQTQVNAASTTAAAAVTVNSPEEFARMAAQSNMMEIETSQLALKNSKNADIQAFAQQMVDDHTSAGKQMQEAAAKDKVKVPSKLNKDHRQMLDKLGKASGADFDKQYSQMQVQAHEQAVALFTSWSQQKGALADLAKTMLPTLQQHLEMARRLPAAS
jgi:putative membrane protein